MPRSASPPGPPLMACHDCDAVQTAPVAPPRRRTSLHCWRCGTVLMRGSHCSIEGGVAYAVAALVLFVIANSFPVARVVLHGKPHVPTFLQSIGVVAEGGHVLLASIVFVTMLLIPLVQILLALYLLLPVWAGRLLPRIGLAFRLFHELKPWSQLDILMLGIVVALGKMSRYAEISIGVTIPALAGAIILPILGSAALDGPYYWAKVAEVQAALRRRPGPQADGIAPASVRGGES